MDFCSIASGSSGNCIYVGSDQTSVLIDTGISRKRIVDGLHEIDRKPEELKGILITHEHSDHIKGLGVMSRKYHIPIYATAGTIDGIRNSTSLGQIDEDLFHTIRADGKFQIEDLEVEPFAISHDAAEPVAYRLDNGEKSVAVVTDLGYYDEKIVSHLKDLDGVLLESNHDIHMLDGSGKSAVCTVTVTGGTTPSQPGSSTGGSSGGSSSDRDSHDSNPVIKTETKNNTDGSTTKTETRRDGSVTQTTTGKDGSVTKAETKKDGSSVTENKAADGSTGTVKIDKNGQTEAAAKVSGKAVEDAKKNGEAVKVPVEVEATQNSSTAPTVSIELPKGAGETKVEIPVSNVTPGTVAVLVHPDGTEEILKDSIPTEDGIQLTVDGSATVKIVDNSKGFIDTQDHWAKDEIDFVSARGLVNGMSATIYAPNASTTRAQLWTILARQNGADLNGGNTWYEKAQNWAKDKGVSDGANHNAAINRAQMVTMLWRAVGQPTAGGTANFTDVPTDSYYAQAVAWAVENGITTGVGNGHFDPTGTCTRAQIAAFLARSMK